MMTRIRVKVILGSKSTETIVYDHEEGNFTPDCLNSIVPSAIAHTVRALGLSDAADLRAKEAEVSVTLSSDDESVRPALHITAATSRLLADAGASLDFDPY
jgi:hypothetical protein